LYDSFIPFTIRLWNALPLTITESPRLNIIKNRLTHFYKTWDTNALLLNYYVPSIHAIMSTNKLISIIHI
jgi:hypothetical protein